MTADRRRGIPAKDFHWTTIAPAPRQRSPSSIMDHGESISKEAEEAKSPGELFGLFFTDQMIDMIVERTNTKIRERLQLKMALWITLLYF